MAKRRLINTKFWEDAYTSELDPIEKLLFLYFLTNTQTNIAGIYEIQLKRIAFDTGIDKEMILKIIERLERDKKLCYKNGYLIIKNFIKNQELNTKVITGIKEVIKGLPEDIKQYTINTLDIDYDRLLIDLDNFNLNSNSNLNSNLNSNIIYRGMKGVFEKFYKDKFKTEYYFEGGKDGKAIKELIKKINFKLVETGKDFKDNDFIVYFEKLLKKTSGWLLNNLTISVFNSQFNKLFTEGTEIKGGGNLTLEQTAENLITQYGERFYKVRNNFKSPVEDEFNINTSNYYDMKFSLSNKLPNENNYKDSPELLSLLEKKLRKKFLELNK